MKLSEKELSPMKISQEMAKFWQHIHQGVNNCGIFKNSLIGAWRYFNGNENSSMLCFNVETHHKTEVIFHRVYVKGSLCGRGAFSSPYTSSKSGEIWMFPV